MNYQLRSYCSVSLTFFCMMLGIFRWLQIILVCNFKCILGHFVKLLFLTIFVFCLFLVCRTFEFDRSSHSYRIWFVWSAFYRADFCQALPKISSRSVTSRPSYSVFIMCHLFKWQKCSFWRIKVTFTFLFLFATACCPYLPIGIID